MSHTRDPRLGPAEDYVRKVLERAGEPLDEGRVRQIAVKVRDRESRDSPEPCCRDVLEGERE